MVGSQQTSITPARLEERIGFLIGYLQRAVKCDSEITYRDIASTIAEKDEWEYAAAIQLFRAAADNYSNRSDAVKLLEEEYGFSTTAVPREPYQFVADSTRWTRREVPSRPVDPRISAMFRKY